MPGHRFMSKKTLKVGCFFRKRLDSMQGSLQMTFQQCVCIEVTVVCQWPFDLTNFRISYMEHNPCREEAHDCKEACWLPTLHKSVSAPHLSLLTLTMCSLYLPFNYPSTFKSGIQICLFFNTTLAPFDSQPHSNASPFCINCYNIDLVMRRQ